jgi:hypothetical protein
MVLRPRYNALEYTSQQNPSLRCYLGTSAMDPDCVANRSCARCNWYHSHEICVTRTYINQASSNRQSALQLCKSSRVWSKYGWYGFPSLRAPLRRRRMRRWCSRGPWQIQFDMRILLSTCGELRRNGWYGCDTPCSTRCIQSASARSGGCCIAQSNQREGLARLFLWSSWAAWCYMSLVGVATSVIQSQYWRIFAGSWKMYTYVIRQRGKTLGGRRKEIWWTSI